MEAVDEPQRQRIQDDLKGLIKGELLFDELSRVLYSTDASIFQVNPLGVVVPRDEEDVQVLVRYAAEHEIALILRGAGTGVAGESLGSGLIIDLSRHFRSILEIGEETVRVQPGVVYRDLNHRLALAGRCFAPDPTSGVQCTLGGMLANNASGAHALRYGYTRDHVVKLRAVFNNGDVELVGLEPRQAGLGTPAGRVREIVQSVSTLLDGNAALLQAYQPRSRYNRCGYLLDGVLSEQHLDLARLLVGSEGTLALFTEAVLRTTPLPGGRSLVLLGFSSLEGAIRASQLALPSGPAACELIDRRLLTLARSRNTDAKAFLPPEAEAVLLIEYQAETEAEAREAALQLASLLHRSSRLAVYAFTAFEPEEIDRLWQLRETALPGLYGLRGGPQPVPFVEDVGVPPEELQVYMHRVQEILKRYETTASFLVHAGTGQVHTRPFLDLQALGGCLETLGDWRGNPRPGAGAGRNGEQPTWYRLARTPWVERQYGRLYPVLRELKAIFDPLHILNPGKIVGPDPKMPSWPLRCAPAARAEPASWRLRWQPGEVRAESLRCNGCGHCRTEAADRRMCPLFRVLHAEAATPRAKANLLRHLLQAETDARLLSSDDVREVADLCINCRMCAQECPAHVNIPKLMLEAKAANTMEHGLDRSDWTLSRTEEFAALASTFAGLTNAVLANRALRWLLEKILGVSRKRRLPAFHGRSFLRRAARRGWTRRPRGRGPRIAYFVDVFANYNDPQLAEAVVAVLHHNGLEVYVPPEQRGCGMAPLAYGDVETAREVAEHNLRILADLAREGSVILCSEPTAALMLRHDYPDLVDDPDAQLVADHVRELTSFLWELHLQGRLRTEFQPLELSIAHHVPCHLKALGQPPAGASLLGLIPGVRVQTLDLSCSGMAGTFGLKAKNHDVSLEIGRPMLEALRRPARLLGSTECSTCRLQMEEGSGKRTLHPVQYLALAYGLMPELSRRLVVPPRHLVLQ